MTVPVSWTFARLAAGAIFVFAVTVSASLDVVERDLEDAAGGISLHRVSTRFARLADLRESTSAATGRVDVEAGARAGR